MCHDTSLLDKIVKLCMGVDMTPDSQKIIGAKKYFHFPGQDHKNSKWPPLAINRKLTSIKIVLEI